MIVQGAKVQGSISHAGN